MKAPEIENIIFDITNLASLLEAFFNTKLKRLLVQAFLLIT